MDNDERLEAFKQDGYTIFHEVYDRATMDAWKQKYAELQENTYAVGERPWWFANTCELAPKLMLPAVANPVVLDFAEAVLGPFVQLDNLTLAAFPSVTREESAGKVSGWHRDRWSAMPQTTEYIHPLAVNAITYMQDLTEPYGPLRIVPGSHRKALTIADKERQCPHPDEQIIHVRAGDVVFIHNGLLHSGTPNTSGLPRYFFSVYYNKSWLKPTDNHHGPNVQRIVEQARARGDRRMLRLFGIDELLRSRCNSGFVTADEHQWAAWIADDRAALTAAGKEEAHR